MHRLKVATCKIHMGLSQFSRRVVLHALRESQFSRHAAVPNILGMVLALYKGKAVVNRLPTRCRMGQIRKPAGGTKALAALGLAVALGAAGCAGPAPRHAANSTPAVQKKPVIAPPEMAKNAEGEPCPLPPPKFDEEIAGKAMANAQDHGFLWRITKNGHSSWLYGTMHVSKPAWMFPGPKVNAAFEKADTVALELDILDPKIRQATKKMRTTVTHRKPVPPELEARIRKQAEALCIPYARMRNLPAAIQVVVLSMGTAAKEGLYPQFAVDNVFAGLGHGLDKHVVSLETPALQMRLLMMLGKRNSLASVNGQMDDLEQKRSLIMFERMARAWAKSDYADMGRFPDWCECMRTPIERKDMRRLLNARNPGMAAKIDAMHRKGASVFAAVGSLHMFGKSGLPALMKRKGYKVERIDLAMGQAAH